MARFRILSSRRGPEGRGCVFRVAWVGSPLSPGEAFEAYEAGHWYSIPVIAISPAPGGADVLSSFALAFDTQFSASIVDTEAPRPERFRYAAI